MLCLTGSTCIICSVTGCRKIVIWMPRKTGRYLVWSVAAEKLTYPFPYLIPESDALSPYKCSQGTGKKVLGWNVTVNIAWWRKRNWDTYWLDISELRTKAGTQFLQDFSKIYLCSNTFCALLVDLVPKICPFYGHFSIESVPDPLIMWHSVFIPQFLKNSDNFT